MISVYELCNPKWFAFEQVNDAGPTRMTVPPFLICAVTWDQELLDNSTDMGIGGDPNLFGRWNRPPSIFGVLGTR